LKDARKTDSGKEKKNQEVFIPAGAVIGNRIVLLSETVSAGLVKKYFNVFYKRNYR